MSRSIRRTWMALLLPLTAAAGLTALGAAGPDEPPAPKDASLLHAASSHPAVAREGPGNTDVYQVWNLEFKTAEACKDFKPAAGIYVDARFDKFAQVMVKDNSIVEKGEADLVRQGLAWGEQVPGQVVPPQPPSGKMAEKGVGTPEETVHGGLNGLTGKGVLLAIVDSGVDFRHPDFVAADGTSRILAYWDTLRYYDKKVGQAAPVSFPDGASCGTVLSQEDLNDDLKGTKRLGPTDVGGHGTACAGIAAGGDALDPKGRGRGVAKDADIIVVRVSEVDAALNEFLLPSICQWLDEKAKERNEPLVISHSIGGHYDSPHDGTLIEEAWLDALLPTTAPGRLMCISAGNEGENRIHARVEFSKAKPAHLSWVPLDPRQKSGAEVQIFLDGVRPGDVKVEPTGDTTFGGIGGQFRLPSNASKMIIDVPPSGGLRLTTSREQTVTADAYIFPESVPVSFDKEVASNYAQIGTPGTARNPFTIGSYEFDDRFEKNGKTEYYGKKYWERLKDLKNPAEALTFGSLSVYSNAGPLRTSGEAVVKPDLVAPGQYFTAPLSADAVISDDRSVEHLVEPFMVGGKDDKYWLFCGTSASAPYTAGVFALLLQENPKLSAQDVRKRLSDPKVLTRDDFTKKGPYPDPVSLGDCPNPPWGYGKLDLPAVKRLIAAVKPD